MRIRVAIHLSEEIVVPINPQAILADTVSKIAAQMYAEQSAWSA